MEKVALNYYDRRNVDNCRQAVWRWHYEQVKDSREPDLAYEVLVTVNESRTYAKLRYLSGGMITVRIVNKYPWKDISKLNTKHNRLIWNLFEGVLYARDILCDPWAVPIIEEYCKSFDLFFSKLGYLECDFFMFPDGTTNVEEVPLEKIHMLTPNNFQI